MNRTKQISASIYSCAMVIFLLASPLASESYAQTCVGSNPRMCADFIGGGNPQHPADFSVSGDNLVLKTAALNWRVWSQVSGGDTTPADFGSITLNPTVSSDNFEVEILNATGGAGAANVGSIVLDDAGFTGYSNLAATTITGTVSGPITLVKDSGGNGGNVTGALTIDTITGLVLILGDVLAPMTITTVSSANGVMIFGNLGSPSQSADLHITTQAGPGAFTIGNVGGTGTNYGDITVVSLNARLSVTGTVPSGHTVTIQNIGTSGYLDVGTLTGLLNLMNGIPDAATTVLINILGGTVDLTGDDVVGHLRLNVGTPAARIINGGAVSGNVTLSYYYFKEFEGIATFDSVPTGGLIDTTFYAELSGELNVTNNVAGTIHILGPFNSGGAISISGSVSGDIELYDTAGSVNISNTLSGDLAIEGDLTGSVTVGDALANRALAGGGRILVTGESSGPIKVGKNTGSLTLIQVAGGLASGSTIEINTTQGAVDAEGDIHIGGTTPTALPFDGCIRIWDETLSGDSGDFTGDIDIDVCYADGDQLVICIDGLDNGNVTLDQTGCDPANATWGCEDPPNCP